MTVLPVSSSRLWIVTKCEMVMTVLPVSLSSDSAQTQDCVSWVYELRPVFRLGQLSALYTMVMTVLPVNFGHNSESVQVLGDDSTPSQTLCIGICV